MADRYAVHFQAFITNGAVITSNVTGRVATAGNTVLTLSTTGGAGTFTITLGSGCTGTLTSGTATITGSPQALAAGANVCTSNGAGNCTLNLTLGTAANWNDVNTWSAASGGVSGASVPTSADNTYFNANSYTAASQVLTVNANPINCLDVDWTGATNNPTLAMAAESTVVNVNGNLTLIPTLTVTPNNFYWWRMYGVNKVLSQNGATLGTVIISIYGATTLGSELNCFDRLRLYADFNSANYNITIPNVTKADAEVVTATLGSSIITLNERYAGMNTGWEFTGANLTLAPNTATINLTPLDGSDNFFKGGGITTYNIVNLKGPAHTITGSNTFAQLNQPGVSHTITFTAGTLQTITKRTKRGDWLPRSKYLDVIKFPRNIFYIDRR